MSIAKLKNKFITGAFIKDVKHFFDKINEIIDHLNDSSSGLPYTAYVAEIEQTGTNVPVATVKSNNLESTISFTYEEAGYYKIISTPNIFDVATVTLGNSSSQDAVISLQRFDDTFVGIFVTQDFGSTGVDDVLDKTLLEIRVYE